MPEVQSNLHLIWSYKFQNNKTHSWAEIGSNLLHVLKKPVAPRKREEKSRLSTFSAVAPAEKRKRDGDVCMPRVY
jgi:hypothetical protein